ncbi:MAG: hypothetical protein RL732_763 [Bacteroidota bacterium]
MRITVIIVSYNVRFFLELCLFSLEKAIGKHSVEIIVADNHSTDDSIGYLKGRFEQVRFLQLGHNIGFAAANNRALAQATGELVLFLNPDTIVPEDLFDMSLEFFHQHPDAGAMGFRMVDGRGQFLRESKRGFPRFWASFYKMTGLAAIFPQSKIFARYYLGHLDEKKSSAVEVLSGAALMARKDVLDELQGFDERFFMYAEDIDLSHRIQRLGYKNYYNPSITLVHFKGESSPHNATYYSQFYGAMSTFIIKYTGTIYPPSLSHSLQLIIRVRILFSTFIRTTRMAVNKIPGSFDMTGGRPTKAIVHDPLSMNRLYVAGQEMSFRNVISLLQKEGRFRNCYFHAEGSKSIAGGSSRRSSGAGFLLP